LLTTFNHYNTKCAGLKLKQDKCKEAGKKETVKQSEKFKRNNGKLGLAKTAFFKEHHTVIDSLHDRWDRRFSFLDDFVHKVISNELMFFESYTKTIKSTKQILDDAMKKPKKTPEKSPRQRELEDKWDFPGDPASSENSSFEGPTAGPARTKKEEFMTPSKEEDFGSNSLPIEGQKCSPFTQGQNSIYALEGTPKKSKRKKMKTRMPRSAPSATRTNPFASSPLGCGHDPFLFPEGEPDHCEMSPRTEEFPIMLNKKITARSGEKPRAENETSCFTGQNPFEKCSIKNNGSNDPFEIFFEKN